jgi:DMSO/TMAO reductase YedYZ molybdopterin-dependent catalytic subunit
VRRRNILAGLAGLFAAGCSRIGDSNAGRFLFDASERLHKTAHELLRSRTALVPEYERHEVSPFFRGNGTLYPEGEDYREHVAQGFANWRLEIGGLVQNPLSLSLSDLKALPQRSQITRHDCVEGWSAIGEWTGPQLSAVLDLADFDPRTRYVVFRCADELNGAPYYESVDLIDAYHPQTIIAHALNGEPLPIRNGAPLRMRIERQLGYKHAKYLTGIDLVESFERIGSGRGGYWEDRGYQWYAGI